MLWSSAGLAAAAVLVALVALALRAGPSTSSARSDTAPRIDLTSPGDGAAAVGQQAPSFSAAAISGRTFQLPAGKPAVLYFMAGWCTSCIPESAALARIDQQLHGKVAILAVDADPTDPLSSLKNFAHQVGDPAYDFAQDEDGKLVQAFDARALDTTVVVDASGRVAYRNTVPIDDATLRAALSQAGLP